MRLPRLLAIALVLVATSPTLAQQTTEEASVRVTFGRPVVRGSLDRAIVLRGMRHHQGALTSCFRRWSPTLKPMDVRLEFMVSDNGLLAPTALKGVEGCIYRSMRGWAFPRPRCGLVQVEVVVRFARRE